MNPVSLHTYARYLMTLSDDDLWLIHGELRVADSHADDWMYVLVCDRICETLPF